MPDEVQAEIVSSPPADGVAPADARRIGLTLPSTRRAAGPLAVVAADRIVVDPAFRLREPGGVDDLARSIAQFGQLFPVELRLRRPNQYQVVAGFRRLDAVRMLKRPRVLARIHPDLSDEDALLMALCDACERRPSAPAELEALRERLEGEGRLSPQAHELLDRALSAATLATPAGEIELDVLADDVARRLAELNQDLAQIADLWPSVEPSLKKGLLLQLRYPSELANYLESLE